MSMELKVDSEKRIDLRPFIRPGEVYRVASPKPGEIILQRVAEGCPPAPASYERALEAVRMSELKFSSSYDDLRKLTREP